MTTEHNLPGSNAKRAPGGLPWPVWAAIYVAVAAATLPAVLPVMVGVLADQLGFGLAHAGYVASANMGGIALGSVVGAALTTRISWRYVILIGTTVMIGTNLLTMFGSSFPSIAALRFASGLGEGIAASVCYVAMGQSGQATRALAFYVAGQGIVGAIGMAVIPTVIATTGWPTLFLLVSVLALPAFALAGTIDTLHHRTGKGASTTSLRSTTGTGWVALGGMLLLFVGLSAMWAFLERIGHAKGIDPFHLSLALSASSIANMVGSLTVAVLAHRVGRVTGLATALSLLLMSLALGIWSPGWQSYVLGAILFFLSWAVYFPFQFGLLAVVDDSGTLAAITPLVTGMGLTIGPAIGGALLANGGSAALSGFSLACVVASTAIGMTLHLRTKRSADLRAAGSDAQAG